jgi:putative hydrolase of the HAD superfamily
VRHFDPDHIAAVEAHFGLDPGSLLGAAFEPALLDRVVTGRMTRRAWGQQVGRRVGAPEAASLWLAETGSVDDEMLAEVERLRTSGLCVAVLTNGTDTIPAEMAALGLSWRFERIFNSAEIGFAKPHRRAFEHVCRELGVEPSTVFFTDDSRSKLRGADEIGMTTRLFTGVAAFRAYIDELVGRDRLR